MTWLSDGSYLFAETDHVCVELDEHFDQSAGNRMCKQFDIAQFKKRLGYEQQLLDMGHVRRAVHLDHGPVEWVKDAHELIVKQRQHRCEVILGDANKAVGGRWLIQTFVYRHLVGFRDNW